MTFKGIQTDRLTEKYSLYWPNKVYFGNNKNGDEGDSIKAYQVAII